MTPWHRLLVAGAAALVAVSLAGPAASSELIGRNARAVKLSVSPNGKAALVTFRAQDRRWHLRAWGAINALAPTTSRPQVSFRLDYSGGRPFRRSCAPYDGPPLRYLVAACKARDGSYWAAQSWPRLVRPRAAPTSAVWELHLSHWTGATAELTVKLDWVERRYDNLYGKLTYRGQPVHGFRSTDRGNPLDSYGRNIYLDTFNSSYGTGWRRENGFLAHKPTGGFCYGLRRGGGQAYRAAVVGPGVTPDVFWESTAPGPFNLTRELAANAEQQAMLGSLCG